MAHAGYKGTFCQVGGFCLLPGLFQFPLLSLVHVKLGKHGGTQGNTDGQKSGNQIQHHQKL